MTTFVTFDQPETKKETNLSDQKLEFVSTSPGEEKGGKFETESGAGGMNLPVNINVSSPMVREWLAKRREEIRPWGSFLNTAHFTKPNTVSALTKRVYRNVDHFQSNYVLVFLILFLYCLITSPMLLIVLAAAGGACYILSVKQRERALVIGGKEINLAQQYVLVGICSIPILLLAGAGSAVFWVLGASIFVIGLHASFYNFDALDVQEDTEKLTGNIVEDV